MANRPSLALMLDQIRVNHTEDCMKTTQLTSSLHVLLFIPESHGTGSKMLLRSAHRSRNALHCIHFFKNPGARRSPMALCVAC